jgi:hypothetical protein
MAKTTRDYNKEMGETGAGIQKAAEIDMNVKNVFTTKWGTYLYPDACRFAHPFGHPSGNLWKVPVVL